MKYAKAHGGDISFTSQLDKGSDFYVHLPKIKPKVLLVDDEKVFRLMLEEALQELDLSIYTAEDGALALLAVEKEEPDLIICDLSMPEMDGYEFLRRLKQNQQTNTIPVIILTTSGAKDNRYKSFSLGADDFVEKPFRKNEIVDIVRKYTF